MKYSNDYRVVVEKKYYAVFTDGSGNEQKVEVTKEVADTIIKEQQAERALVRKNERNTISLDALDYEGEIFATYDDYGEEKELSLEEKVKTVLSQMKPEQAELLKMSFYDGLTHEEIGEIKHVTRPAITQQITTAKRAFKKIFEKLFPKSLHFASFLSE